MARHEVTRSAYFMAERVRFLAEGRVRPAAETTLPPLLIWMLEIGD